MENGKHEQVISQFDKIAELPDTWDHNQQYQKYLLNNLSKCGSVLDVGCGTGGLTKILSKYADKVIGIDVSPNMIATAEARNTSSNIEYLVTDVESYLDELSSKFDAIICIAALHHMNEESALRKMKNHLNKNGKILILDLYKQNSAVDYLLSGIATAINPFKLLIKRGIIQVTIEEREAWKDHFQFDEYKTIDALREIGRRVFGEIRIRRHLFWRYSMIYTKAN